MSKYVSLDKLAYYDSKAEIRLNNKVLTDQEVDELFNEIDTEDCVYLLGENNWVGTINCYAWNYDENKAFSVWPGTPMILTDITYDNFPIYKSVKFDTDYYDKCIFTNGSTQTSDLDTQEGKCYKYSTLSWLTLPEPELRLSGLLSLSGLKEYNTKMHGSLLNELNTLYGKDLHVIDSNNTGYNIYGLNPGIYIIRPYRGVISPLVFSTVGTSQTTPDSKGISITTAYNIFIVPKKVPETFEDIGIYSSSNCLVYFIDLSTLSTKGIYVNTSGYLTLYQSSPSINIPSVEPCTSSDIDNLFTSGGGE